MDKVVEPKVVFSIELISGVKDERDFRSEFDTDYVDEITTIIIEMIEKYPQFGCSLIQKMIDRMEHIFGDTNKRKDIS